MGRALDACRPHLPSLLPRRDHAGLTAEERREFQHCCKQLPVPAEWMYDGSRWVSFDGSVSYLHPAHEDAWRECEAGLNRRVDEFNATIRGLQARASREAEAVCAGAARDPWWQDIPDEPTVSGPAGIATVMGESAVQAAIRDRIGVKDSEGSASGAAPPEAASGLGAIESKDGGK